MLHYFDQVINQFGQPIGNVSVRVNLSNGGGLASIFSDDGVTAKTNPLATDIYGRYDFYVASGRYDLQFSGTGITTTTKQNVDIVGPEELLSTIVFAAQTASLGSSTLYAVPANETGVYRITFSLVCTTQGSAGTVTANFAWNNGQAQSFSSGAVSLSSLGSEVTDNVTVFVATAPQNLTYSTTVVGNVAGAYDFRVRVEYLG